MRLFISSILTVTMIGFVPLSYAEQGGSHVQLSDGSKAPKDHVNNVRSSLQRLSKESPSTFQALVNKANNPRFTLPDNRVSELQQYGLMNENGELSEYVPGVIHTYGQTDSSGNVFLQDPNPNVDVYDQQSWYNSGGGGDGSYYHDSSWHHNGRHDGLHQGDHRGRHDHHHGHHGHHGKQGHHGHPGHHGHHGHHSHHGHHGHHGGGHHKK